MAKRSKLPLRKIALTEIHSLNEVPSEVQLLPRGWTNTKKGKFLVDDESIRLILRDFQTKANDAVIDYEHQTLTGQQAPAAGWIMELVDKGDDGLWGRVEWTDRAKEYLANREYRYLSPVIHVREDGKVIGFINAGLTNFPAIDGMVPVSFKDQEMEEEQPMNEFLKKLAAALGLPETATEEEVLTAIQELAKNKDVKPDAQYEAFKSTLAQALGMGTNASDVDIRATVLSLKASSDNNSVVKDLQERLDKRDREEVIQLALTQGKITPAQKDWAENYAKVDLEGFRKFVETAPQLVPMGSGSTTYALKNNPGAGGLDDSQANVNKLLNIDAETYKKYGGDQ
ncbi:phage protease [Brevibacillus centrosporus]|uniref:Mu-like prophage I protein n=1 Tax=Brevibacillus centrosporus TaxID=54910 RepID=A0A1I3LZY8_9BACL|nr:phage protease [Brevibacillus centrosporus]SFI90371.1 Mu-like prophage I protein [Brevibacillus centrosporus]